MLKNIIERLAMMAVNRRYITGIDFAVLEVTRGYSDEMCAAVHARAMDIIEPNNDPECSADRI